MAAKYGGVSSISVAANISAPYRETHGALACISITAARNQAAAAARGSENGGAKSGVSAKPSAKQRNSRRLAGSAITLAAAWRGGKHTASARMRMAAGAGGAENIAALASAKISAQHQ